MYVIPCIVDFISLFTFFFFWGGYISFSTLSFEKFLYHRIYNLFSSFSRLCSTSVHPTTLSSLFITFFSLYTRFYFPIHLFSQSSSFFFLSHFVLLCSSFWFSLFSHFPSHITLDFFIHSILFTVRFFLFHLHSYINFMLFFFSLHTFFFS